MSLLVLPAPGKVFFLQKAYVDQSLHAWTLNIDSENQGQSFAAALPCLSSTLSEEKKPWAFC